MIRYYYRPKNSGDPVQILEKYKAGAWVHVESPTEEDIQEIAKEFKLDEDILLDVLDENEMPRVERGEKETYLFTRHAYTDDELRITTSPILFAITKNTLFTFTPERFNRIDKLVNGSVSFSSSQHVALMLNILDQIDDEYEAKLNSISRQIKSIRSRLRVEEIRNKDFIDFVTIEDVLNEFLSALSPTNSILRRLLLGKHFSLAEDDRDLVEDLLLNNEQSIEGCRSTLKTIVNIREAYSTIMSNNLNRVIRLLTVLTVIISIPTLVTSTYGMNVELPFEKSPLAFSGIMVVSLILSTVLLVTFKNRRWL